MAKYNSAVSEKDIFLTENIPPPAYDEIFSSGDLPPPYPLSYEKHEIFDKSLLPDSQNIVSSSQFYEEIRCSTCFDPIREDTEKKRSGDLVRDGMKSYHYECYVKSRGPKCDHCCFALIPWPNKHLTGRWVTYEGKRYHEECYEREAGPRCSLCCNVIVEKPQQGYSGKWRWQNGKRYHDECFMKTMYNEIRAKNS